MPLSTDCIGRMIKAGRTYAVKLIARDLEKAYSGLSIAR
jgi:hypothetical protein